MKNYLTIIFIAFTLIGTSQSELSYGVKGGINYSRSYTDFRANKVIYGFNIGGTFEKDFNDYMSVQTEINYNLKGIESVISGPSPQLEAENRLGYIDVPLLFQLKFAKRISFQAGPQIGFLVYENSEIDGVEVNLDVTKTTFGLVGGFEIMFLKRFFTQLRYEYGLSKIIQSDTLRFSVFSLHLGFIID